MSDIWPSLVEQLSETISVEYKSAAPWGKIRQKVMRTAIAMANTQDGGFIVIGVRQVTGGYVATGLNARQRSTYADVENLQTQISQCSAPTLEVGVSLRTDGAGKCFAVVSVAGLRTIPHISVRNLEAAKQGITKGVVYIRTNLPSTEACDQSHWENLMRRAGADMADEFLRRMHKVGCGLQLAPPPRTSNEDIEAQFRRERGAQ